MVADKMLEIVRNKSWKLRHPIDSDAEPYLQYRASKTDEQWVDMMALESDQEFVALIKRDFGIDLELP